MDFSKIHSVYFIGIGGIGMSALARWCNQQGFNVAGYDKNVTELTKTLTKENISIHYEDNISMIDDLFLNRENTLIVYTPAIPAEHNELKYFNENNFNIKKRSEVLGQITQNNYTIAVAGTHGKTSTASMIAYLLTEGTKTKCTAFVGGIMTNYNTNLLIGDKDATIVVEADEFDRSLMKLYPNYVIITSTDLDHLDIYQNESDLINTYSQFINKNSTKQSKRLLNYSTIEKMGNVNGAHYYSINKGEICAKNVKVENESFVFDYHTTKNTIKKIQLQTPGYHNVENALSAITVALDLGIQSEKIKQLLSKYKGVKRRFEYIYKNNQITFIDDYAHHPTEIDSLIKSIKKMMKDKKITLIFQPHLYSRTQYFKNEFAKVLDQADEIVLLEIYPARELPIPKVTSQIIFDEMTNNNKKIIDKQQIIKTLETQKIEVLITVGAGDIDKEVPKIADYLKRKFGPSLKQT